MKADSGDEEKEDSKPPARDTKTISNKKGQGTSSSGVGLKKMSQQQSGEGKQRSLKKPPPGAQNVASLPKKGGGIDESSLGGGAKPAAKKKGTSKKAGPLAADTGSSPRAKRPRQKMMDEDAPADETAEEKRLRRNRINDRRKRARRAMKVDFLNEQFENLKAQNDSIKQQNQTLRSQISAIRRAMGMEDASPATPAEAGQEAAAATAGENTASTVLSNVVRSRLDGSILAALNRQLQQQQHPSPSLSATTSERPAQVPSAASSRQVQGGEPQANNPYGANIHSGGFQQQQGGSRRTSAAPSPQQLPQVARRGSEQEQQSQAMASLMASLINRQHQRSEGTATGTGQAAVREQSNQESFAALLSSLQQQPTPRSPASSHSSMGGQAHQDHPADIESLLAILQGQQQPSTDSNRGRSSSSSGQTPDRNIPSSALLQQLENTRASGSSNRDSAMASLRQLLRDSRNQEQSRSDALQHQGRQDFTLSQDELSALLRRRDGSFDEAQGGTRRQQTMEQLLRSIQEGPPEESSRNESLMAAFQDLLRDDSASNQRMVSQLQSQNAGSAIYALAESLHGNRGAGGPTGRASSARQQDQPSIQPDELRALLQMHQSMPSGQQRENARDDVRMTPDLIAALQQLQGGGGRDRASSDPAGSFQSQTENRARQGLFAALQTRQSEHQANQNAERLLTSLQRQQSASSGSGNETIEDILHRLQQEARGRAPSPQIQPDRSTISRLLQQSRDSSASPSAGASALDESIVQQILASQGLLSEQPSHSSPAPTPMQAHSADSALAQSILASMGNLYGTLSRPDSPGRESDARSLSSRNQVMSSPASAPELAINNRIAGIASSMSDDQLRTLAAQLSGQTMPSESNATFSRRQREPAALPSNFQTAAQTANLQIMQSLQQQQQQRGGRSALAQVHSLLPQQEQQQQQEQRDLLWLLSGSTGAGTPNLASQVATQRLMPAASHRFGASSARGGDEKDSKEEEGGDSKTPH